MEDSKVLDIQFSVFFLTHLRQLLADIQKQLPGMKSDFLVNYAVCLFHCFTVSEILSRQVLPLSLLKANPEEFQPLQNRIPQIGLVLLTEWLALKKTFPKTETIPPALLKKMQSAEAAIQFLVKASQRTDLAPQDLFKHTQDISD